MRLRLALLVAVALPAFAADAAAQRPPVRRETAADSLARVRAQATADSLRRARGDTARADTAHVLIRWAEPDTVIQRLLATPGYSITRYQGEKVTFGATQKTLELLAPDSGLAAVLRDGRLITSDTSIHYTDLTGDVRAKGTIVLSDSTSGQGDVVSRGFVEYNLRARSALITNARFKVESGETWYITANRSQLQLPDSTGRREGLNPTFRGLGGTLTSCDDTTHAAGPHYHFEFRQIKRTGTNTLVARPAVLYIQDIPVFWLPFVYQDMRKGRRSGILTPRFGVADIIRNSPTYRRNVENLGYYFAISDYMDAETSVDWLSNSGGREGDLPGWTRFNAEWRYRWLNRFLTGSIAASHQRTHAGNTNTSVSWQHQQEFSRNSSLTANINWAENTTIQRETTINPYASLATISSQLNYQQKLGPAQISLGGSRRQYTGRKQVDQTIPTLSITAGTINVAKWLEWTPSFNFNQQQTLNADQGTEFPYQFFRDAAKGGALDSTRTRVDSRTTTANFETPIQIFGYDLRNSFRFSDIANEFPATRRVYRDIRDTSTRETRVYAATFRSELDWTPGFALPSFSQGRWNITPSVSFTNVDPSAFLVRTELSDGRWVAQSKRPTFSLGVSPTFYGLFPGFGPFSAFRHSFNPTVSYGFAPKADVSDEFLRAVGRERTTYLGSLAQNSLSLGINQSVEAKVRSATDTNPDAGEKLRVLSLSVSSLTYDFERARKTGRPILGLTTPSFNYSVRSDLLPGIDFSVNYSLFEGDPITSDTAKFSPYRTGVSASFSLSNSQNPFAVLARLFGRPVPQPATPGQATLEERPDEQLARQLANQPVAGSRARQTPFVVPPSHGWNASFTFSSNRTRPPGKGSTVIETDPAQLCEVYRFNPLQYDFCVAQVRSSPNTQAPLPTTAAGGAVFRSPPVTTLGSNVSFNLTPKWSASWQTTYDLERSDFASQIVSLQRELHDWRAVFAFTQSPNGNFAFNFFIALKAQPDLKFDYNRASYRQEGARF